MLFVKSISVVIDESHLTEELLCLSIFVACKKDSKSKFFDTFNRKLAEVLHEIVRSNGSYDDYECFVDVLKNIESDMSDCVFVHCNEEHDEDKTRFSNDKLKQLLEWEHFGEPIESYVNYVLDYAKKFKRILLYD